MMWLLSLPGAVKRWAIIAGAALLAVLGIYAKGRSDRAADDAIDKAKAAAKSTERMNNVDTMRDASDADRIARLRDFAKRNDRP